MSCPRHLCHPMAPQQLGSSSSPLWLTSLLAILGGGKEGAKQALLKGINPSCAPMYPRQSQAHSGKNQGWGTGRVPCELDLPFRAVSPGFP